MKICSCGNAEPHVMARRLTADDVIVKIWSDGAVTTGLNTYVVRGSHGANLSKAIAAAWLVAGECCLYDANEIRKLCLTARKAVRQLSFSPLDYLRKVMSGAKFQAIRKGAVVRHARSCECPSCERERIACGGTLPFRGPRRVGV